MSDIVQLFTADEAVSRANFNQRLVEINKIFLTSDKTIYVRKTGDDETGDGSNERPFLTIGKALSYVRTLNGTYGIELLIGDGTYNENIDTAHSISALKIKSESSIKENVIINAPPNSIAIKSFGGGYAGYYNITINANIPSFAVRLMHNKGYLYNCLINNAYPNLGNGIIGENSSVNIDSCTINTNNGLAIGSISGGVLSCSGNKGSGNNIAYKSELGFINIANNQITATTLKVEIPLGTIKP